MKVAYNSCYGEFDLSDKALELYNQKREKLNLPKSAALIPVEGTVSPLPTIESSYEINYRHDPILVEVIEELAHEANTKYSNLKIKKIPDKYGCYYEIKEYDGRENVNCGPIHLIQNMLESKGFCCGIKDTPMETTSLFLKGGLFSFVS